MRVRTITEPTAKARPENELLLCCARVRMEPERAERIVGLLQHDLDWTYLLRTALWHGLMPLLYWNLKRTCPEAIPKPTLDQLQDHFHNNTRRNFFLTGELLKLLKLFEAHQIPVIPYKGPVLAASVYGNLGLREFTDLDLLVQKKHVLKAKSLLLSQGYQPVYRLTHVQEAALLKSLSQLTFSRDDGRLAVDLHTEVTPRDFTCPLEPQGLWERLEPLSLGGHEILTLSPEDSLLILCAHGAKHLWERLGWICDVAELIADHHGRDWGGVMQQASKMGSERMLLLGLFLACDLVGTALPEEVLQRVKADRAVKPLAARVREGLFRNAHGETGILERCLFYLRTWDRQRHGIRYCLSLALAPTAADRVLLRLPPFLFPAYYALRPMRLVGKYGLGGLRSIL